jgi:hypothetical protein
MHFEHIPSGQMQPRENDDLIPRLDALEPVEKGWLEDKQSVGRTLIALFWGRCQIG